MANVGVKKNIYIYIYIYTSSGLNHVRILGANICDMEKWTTAQVNVATSVVFVLPPVHNPDTPKPFGDSAL